MITENAAKLVNGSYITVKLSDILEPKPIDNRTADDIIEGIRNKLK